MNIRHLWPAMVLAALLGIAHLVVVPTFWPVDETAHVAYATELVEHGRVPSIDDPIPRDLRQPGLAQRLYWERDQGRQGRLDIWTANHPPLPYALQGTALWIGDGLIGRGGGMALARLVSTAWLVLGVWATGVLAGRLAQPVRGRARRRWGPHAVGALAATTVAVTPTLSHLAGVVFNDTAGFAMTTCCLLLGVETALRGPGRRTLPLLALLTAVGGLTRVTVLPAIGLMWALVAYGWWRTAQVDRPRLRPRQALWALAVIPPAAFWIGNVVRYGDPTASTWLLDKFQRDLNEPLATLLGSRVVWLRLWDRMLADLTTGHWAGGLRADLTEAVLVAGLVGAGLGLARWVRGPRRSPVRRRGWDVRLRRNPVVVCWTACGVLVAFLALAALEFHASGGSLHGRYGIGGMAVVATAIVVLLAAAGRVGRIAATLVPAVLMATNGLLLAAVVNDGSRTWRRPGIDLDLPRLAGDGAPEIAAVLFLLATALLAATLVAGPGTVPAATMRRARRALADPARGAGRALVSRALPGRGVALDEDGQPISASRRSAAV
ncbi:hypothetical protein [Euzebya rosea]|uniref:hypothetical protein n=1 Tax=Euzebya rosea TaxID=2052804 RepID=UPI00130071F5|nr:hypothetical protein [Euzebya rosea]